MNGGCYEQNETVGKSISSFIEGSVGCYDMTHKLLLSLKLHVSVREEYLIIIRVDLSALCKSVLNNEGIRCISAHDLYTYVQFSP